MQQRHQIARIPTWIWSKIDFALPEVDQDRSFPEAVDRDRRRQKDPKIRSVTTLMDGLL